MKKTKFTESQILKALKEAESGRPVSDISRELGINPQTFYNWKKKYSGMNGEQLQRLKELEDPTKYVHDEKVIAFLSTRIRKIREEKGITQEELANEAEIGLAQLKRIELGLVNTSISSIYRIANALNLTVGELFGKFR